MSSAAEEAAKPKNGYLREVDAFRDQVLSRVLAEHDVIHEQRKKRMELLEKLESQEDGRKVGYLGFLCSEGAGASIDSDDIPAFGDVLASLGDLDQLNVILNSPGGDGTVAEKMIELCRAYCKEFRVIVPNRAKSAATIIALGADQIVMGYCSELGPIDAQVPVVVGGLIEFISAQSFIDARSSLEKKFQEAVKNSEDPRAILQQIAGLDAPFIDHCEKLMDFSREVARKYLDKSMFSGIKPAARRKAMVQQTLKRLSSTDIFKVHGRMIDANTAKTDLKLNVVLLGKDDPLWKLIWQYYVRADVFMSRPPVIAKLIETKSEMLMRAGVGGTS